MIVLAILLFATSIRSEIRVIDDAITLGEAPPGVHERDVPFNRTTLFRVSLTIGSCVVDFYLLDDQQYDIYTRSGTLPPPTIDCSRPERLLNSPVRHLVTVNRSPGNVSYSFFVTFLAFTFPHVLLSVPATAIALAATVWMAMTMLIRGTDRLGEELKRRRTQ